MALSGIGELVAAPLFVLAIWLAGAVYIKAVDYWMQNRRGAASSRGPARRTVNR